MKTATNSRPCRCCSRRIATAKQGKRQFCSTPCRKLGEAIAKSERRKQQEARR